MKRIGQFILIAANIVTACGLVVTAWVGALDPTSWPRLTLLSMTFPLWVPLAFLMLIINFFAARRQCIVIACSMALALPMTFTVYPLNIPRGEVPTPLKSGSWTLMTYNCLNLKDRTGLYPGDENTALRYIIDTNADVVVLQECSFKSGINLHITQQQVDELNQLYPWRIIHKSVSILSKFPVKDINIGHIAESSHSTQISAQGFVADIHGRPVLIIGTHLKSMDLSKNDIALYGELRKGDVTTRAELGDVKTFIIRKVMTAGKSRAHQARQIVNAIDSLGYSDVVVCGDFNDTPGCYTLRKLADIGLTEAYPLVGLGYMLTYNAHGLPFQIDHVLSRGTYTPWHMERGNLKASDHYPLTVTFVERP